MQKLTRLFARLAGWGAGAAGRATADAAAVFRAFADGVGARLAEPPRRIAAAGRETRRRRAA